MVDLDKLEALLKAATKPPWVAHDDAGHMPGSFEPNRVVDGEGFGVADVTGNSDKLEVANCVLIATLRNKAPLLIAEVRRLRERVDRTKMAEAELRECYSVVPAPMVRLIDYIFALKEEAHTVRRDLEEGRPTNE